MTWNFRLVRHVGPPPKKIWYGVHEVFYNDKGRAFTMTEDPVNITGETPKEMRRYLQMISRDIRRLPVLDLSRIRWGKPPWDPADVAETIRKVRRPARR